MWNGVMNSPSSTTLWLPSLGWEVPHLPNPQLRSIRPLTYGPAPCFLFIFFTIQTIKQNQIHNRDKWLSQCRKRQKSNYIIFNILHKCWPGHFLKGLCSLHLFPSDHSAMGPESWHILGSVCECKDTRLWTGSTWSSVVLILTSRLCLREQTRKRSAVTVSGRALGLVLQNHPQASVSDRSRSVIAGIDGDRFVFGVRCYNTTNTNTSGV